VQVVLAVDLRVLGVEFKVTKYVLADVNVLCSCRGNVRDVSVY
jgi:hypothetical protein